MRRRSGTRLPHRPEAIQRVVPTWSAACRVACQLLFDQPCVPSLIAQGCSAPPARLLSKTTVNGQVEVSAGGQVKVPTPRVDSGFLGGTSLLGAGLAHAVGLAVGDDDVGVVQ